MMEENHRRKGATTYTEMGFCFRRLQRIGTQLLVTTSQEIILTLVHRNKPGTEGYSINRKA